MVSASSTSVSAIHVTTSFDAANRYGFISFSSRLGMECAKAFAEAMIAGRERRLVSNDSE